jgi:UDP:flavonoid glycosyltransferase YjiC (YdhE family)
MGLSPLLDTGVRLTERYIKKSLKIIVPDNPPPYTICELGLGDLKNIGIKERVEFVGSFVDTAPINGVEEHIFAPISGPLGTRAKLQQMLIPALASLKEKSIVSLGEPGEKKNRRIGNCTIHTWLSSDSRANYMRNASLVIFSGGHATCFEIVKYAKPSICVPTQLEQFANGAKLELMGCSLVVKDEAQLEVAIKTLKNQNRIIRDRVERLREFSNRFRGLDRAAEIISSVL